MEEIVIRFLNEVNVSLSMGDIVYYKPTDGGVVRVGPVISIGDDRLSIRVNRSLAVASPGAGDFIFFAKDKGIESSGIIGYEATVTMVNSSTKKAELYAVSTEVFESSK